MIFKHGSQYPIDLSELSKLLIKAKIGHTLRAHPAFVREAKAKELIGYYPAGEWQIIIPVVKKARPNRRAETFSIIRGMVSWGMYEIWGPNMDDPRREEDAEDMLNLIKKLIKKYAKK